VDCPSGESEQPVLHATILSVERDALPVPAQEDGAGAVLSYIMPFGKALIRYGPDQSFPD